jgi:acetyl esterase/lipase
MTPDAIKSVKGDDGSVPTAMLLGEAASEAAATAASPISYARAGFPPTILFQGTEDSLIGNAGPFELMLAMHAAEVPCEVHYFAGANHEFDMTPFYAVLYGGVHSGDQRVPPPARGQSGGRRPRDPPDQPAGGHAHAAG